MALQSWGHSHFWDASDTGGGGGGDTGALVSYPLWRPGWGGSGQGAVFGSGCGGLQPWWDRLTGLVALVGACRRCDPQQFQTLAHTARVIQSPIYQTARQAVRETAVTPKMRDHHTWHEIGRVAKAWNWSENIYRRVHANEAADRALRFQGSTVTHEIRELAVELAYHEYKAKT